MSLTLDEAATTIGGFGNTSFVVTAFDLDGQRMIQGHRVDPNEDVESIAMESVRATNTDLMIEAEAAAQIESAAADHESATAEVEGLNDIVKDPGSVTFVGVLEDEKIRGRFDIASWVAQRIGEQSPADEHPPGVELETMGIGGEIQIADPQLGGSCSSSWWPYDGRISTQSSSSGGRYSYTANKWSQWRLDNLYACRGETGTYESDAVYDGYDGRNFLGDSVLSWSTNFPEGYLDTRAFDSGNEPTYSIGTRVRRLDAQTNYTTYIRVNKGNSSQDRGKLNGQRGWCWNAYTTHAWCVSGDSTKRLILAWNHAVPGRTYY